MDVIEGDVDGNLIVNVLLISVVLVVVVVVVAKKGQ